MLRVKPHSPSPADALFGHPALVCLTCLARGVRVFFKSDPFSLLLENGEGWWVFGYWLRS
jgi:hypothetical protein